MARLKVAHLALVAGLVALLSGCTDGRTGGDAAAPRAPARTGKAVERDVEMPEVFRSAEKGLWDGRPSIGGIWVAHPAVDTPERVLIRNAANGRAIEGALFRRERDLPGPVIQVSSDAAEALGMLAGQPAELTVVALRRQAVAAAPPPAAKPEDGAAATVPVADAAPAAAASATGRRPEARPGAAAKPPAAAKPAAAAEAPAAADPAPTKRKWWQKKPKPGAAPAEAAAPGAGKPATGVSTDTIIAAPLDSTPAPAPRPAKRAADTDAAAPAAPEPTAAPDPAAAPATGDGVAAGGNLSLPYIQIGTFSQQSNADEAAETLRKAGIGAEVRRSENGGKPVWRVVAGPAKDIAARNAMLEAVGALGFKDAFPVAG